MGIRESVSEAENKKRKKKKKQADRHEKDVCGQGMLRDRETLV